ncbi:Ig-like domain (group 2) [Paenibacillus sp. UNCCL117]|uniref:Ig-like domain-containing protein n=1 Tax=unclassified Paenibacillus TaxID=185978 RepID=UPI000885D1B5|nr:MULTISPECIES: Ig-like domain-containing protein [unclassified Paenibacillus]SDE20085.1 Ig-like domain (group 2) [Paenibacillus sp. cl123]SFW61862.1 Ig-like domain (group 2) [Paenibacillus sp. UNCCL117]
MNIGKQVMLIWLSLLLVSSSFPMLTASAAEQREPVMISGNFTSIDFNVTAPTVSNNVYTLDSKFLGTASMTPGSNSAGRVADSDDSHAFFMEASTAAINSFKSGINKADRFGIQTRVKFNNTNSKRSLFEVKSMTPPSGTAAWPTLLTFDELGKIKDAKGNPAGTYAADQWYDIVVDVDSPNHRYSAWINGELAVDHVDLGNFTGVTQNKMIQNTNAGKTPSRITIAYLKAGTVSDSVPLSGLSIQPLNGDFFVNQTAPLTLVKTPSNSADHSYNWLSSHTDIVEVDSQGVITGRRPGTARITVSSAQNPSITASIDITVKAMTAPILINPSYLNADYSNSNLQVNNNVVTVDSNFLGKITANAGSSSAGLISDNGSNVLYLEAVNSSLNTFKSAINKTDRFAIQTRVKFNNTDSSRSLFEMKSMNPPAGTPAWPTLLTFDQAGRIKDYKGNVLGSYAADQWYDIVVDMDTPNHRYSVWINGEVKVNNLDLGNFVGVSQNKIIQNTNASKTASRTFIAYMKVSDIVLPLQDFELPDREVVKGKAAILTTRQFLKKPMWSR